jgi:uncharacterized membrane protein
MVLPISSDRAIGVFYAILPWTGVMLLGYCVAIGLGKSFQQLKEKNC